MAFNMISRLGLFTGALYYTTQLGVWAAPKKPGDIADLKPIAKSTADCGSSFSAQRDYNYAMKRGFYFAYRLSDWTNEFLSDTREIFNENVPKFPKKQQKPAKDLRTWPDAEKNRIGYDTSIAEPQQIKPPMIKDDITCGKRVNSSLLSKMIIDLALRTGVVVAVIMATKHYGIWGSTDKSEEIYGTATVRLQPYASKTCDYLNIYVPPMPPQRARTFLSIHYYNEAVKTFSDFLIMFPTYTHDILYMVPGFVHKYYLLAREKYLLYRSDVKKQKEEKRRVCIDDKPLVLPVPPPIEPKCKCREKIGDDKAGLLPKSPAPTPSPYKSKCKCPNCRYKEQEELDCKRKCPKYESKQCVTKDR